jgi:ATP-dependent DNA ligase
MNMITLGPIFNTQGSKVRSWKIVISLFDINHKQISISNLDMDVKDGCTAEYYTVSGYLDMKMTQSSPTVVATGKNLGKKNATNVLTQAHNECTSKYNLKIKSGYETKIGETEVVVTNKIPFPMALKPWKDFKEKLRYPLYVQPKLDGIRMIAHLTKDNTVQLFTRRLHIVPGFENIKRELLQMYMNSNHKDMFIDGEVYCHGMDLQQISGIVRREKDDDREKDKLQFWVFDCFSVDQPKLTFVERFDILNSMVDSKKYKSIIVNETLKIEMNNGEDDKYFKKIVSKGFEGIIYKSSNKPYEFSFNKEKRSMWYLKRKQQFDDEFEIIDFAEGKGKDLGCVIFIMKTKNGVTFNSVPNGTYDYRKELYTECINSFNTSFKGKMAKVSYEDISTDGIPLRNRMIMVRDLSFD